MEGREIGEASSTSLFDAFAEEKKEETNE